MFKLIKTNSNLNNLILNKLYPIGSIYLTTNNTNPSTLLGGTWEAYGASDTYLRLGGNGSGGSNSTTLAANQIPSLTTGNQSANHTHGMSSHTHGVGTFAAASNGSHQHTVSPYTTNNNTKQNSCVMAVAYYASGTARSGVNYGSVGSASYYDIKADSAGAHGHTISGTSAGPSTANTGNQSANHTHTYTNNSQQSVTIAPKYVQVYAWKRTA